MLTGKAKQGTKPEQRLGKHLTCMHGHIGLACKGAITAGRAAGGSLSLPALVWLGWCIVGAVRKGIWISPQLLGRALRV